LKQSADKNYEKAKEGAKGTFDGLKNQFGSESKTTA